MVISPYRITDLERAVQTLQFESADLKEELARLKRQVQELEAR